MNEKFCSLIESLEPSLQRLLKMTPVSAKLLPPNMPSAGIYLLSEGDHHFFVGRSNRLRQRLQEHCRPSAGHNTAPFAFKLARIATGHIKASYTGEGSRNELESDPEFKSAFMTQKDRVGNMDIRIVEESNPIKQALLEIYVSISLDTTHNCFDNH